MKKTRKILSEHKKVTEHFTCTQKSQNLICMLPEHSTVVSFCMLKRTNISAIVVAENLNIPEHVVVTL